MYYVSDSVSCIAVLAVMQMLVMACSDQDYPSIYGDVSKDNTSDEGKFTYTCLYLGSNLGIKI